jgi:Ubiquitin family
LCSKTQVHWVNGNDTVKVLKEMIYEWTGISIRHQKIAFAGQNLEDLKTLSEYDIHRDCTISVTRIRGGGETVASHGVGYKEVMNELELDHYGYLMEKIIEVFRQDEVSPHYEVCCFVSFLMA